MMTLRILSGIGIGLILRRDERCSEGAQWDSAKSCQLSAVSRQLKCPALANRRLEGAPLHNG